MKYFKLALIGLIVVLACAFVQKSLNNDLTDGLAKAWQITYVLIDGKEMTANEVPDLACIKKHRYTFYANNALQIDTSCTSFHTSLPTTQYVLNDSLMILDGDTMQLVELNSFKLKLRRKIPVEGDSVTISPETAFVNFDLILYPSIIPTGSGGR